MILVSCCLLKINTKYDGTNNECPALLNSPMLHKFIPVCPEHLGGLPTPRCPVQLFGGSGQEVLQGKAEVLDANGTNYTEQFIKGAHEVLKIAKIFSVKAAILKERSPSCGCHQIYDGSFSGKLREGEGVTTALLRRERIPVYSEEQISEELLKSLLSN